jgi:hypothetical protein
MTKRATPSEIMNEKTSTITFQNYNGKDCERDLIDFNFNQNFNQRLNLYNSIYTSMSKIDFEWKNTILLAKSIT